MDIIFDDLTKIELEDTVEYYELEVPGLGLRFKAEVKNSLYRINKYPENRL